MAGEGMSPVLELDGISKQFRDGDSSCLAVEEISCSLEKKEIVALMGPSGCGKSTVLRIISGLDTADGGSVQGENGTFGEKNPAAMVFQDHGLFPWLSVSDNIAYGLKLKVRSKSREQIRKKVSDLLSLVRLSEFAGSLPHQLSGGMKQRVAVARALAVEPEILLMDEPFSALDPFTRRELQDEVLRIREELSTTFFIVTHNPEEAVYLADRILILTQRPSRILKEVPVPWAHPRNMADPDIISLVQEVTRIIAEESSRTSAMSGPDTVHPAR
jgi:NitT/TauT family transport system ATP-binding protein